MPEAYLLFDERGVAQDGTLRHDGVEVDIRAERFVAVLVNRDALGGDDADVQRRLLRALRLTWWVRMLAYTAPLFWVALLAGGAWRAATGHGLFDVLAPALMVVMYGLLWVAQRWRERRTPLQ